jgi:pimeloyl-ACP methyl ester carboxylesterase
MRLLAEGTVDRAVVVFGIDEDPGPELTYARGVSLFAADAGGEIGAEIGAEIGGAPIGVVGQGDAGPAALAFAARHPDRVDRLAVIATPIPDDLGFDLSEVTAKTLLLFGAKDLATGSRHGRWWQERLPDARLEMNPQGGNDLLRPMWKRVLSHLAPRCRR